MSNKSSWPVIWNDDAEEINRLKEDASRTKNWKRWGPYLSERQWGTVREDYSENGEWYADKNIITYFLIYYFIFLFCKFGPIN